MLLAGRCDSTVGGILDLSFRLADETDHIYRPMDYS